MPRFCVATVVQISTFQKKITLEKASYVWPFFFRRNAVCLGMRSFVEKFVDCGFYFFSVFLKSIFYVTLSLKGKPLLKQHTHIMKTIIIICLRGDVATSQIFFFFTSVWSNLCTPLIAQPCL